MITRAGNCIEACLVRERFKSTDLGKSFTGAPKRTTTSSIPPSPPSSQEGFSRSREDSPFFTLLEGTPRPAFSSLSTTPKHFTPPNGPLPHTRVIYRPSRRIVFYFYGHPFQWKTILVGIQILQLVYANFQQDFTLTNGLVSCVPKTAEKNSGKCPALLITLPVSVEEQKRYFELCARNRESRNVMEKC
ncbi:hypothetical protein AVEN_14414-1 [Araneus ventricosus]|uniref:Uncharacterized protein n=1 Tax=Araneus ventricosus TaxID=182803 RepID=A0A4Y2QBZ4_ARAVE|nr:hypothetical protein AVEN_14414-1 [Araneus ventricosus]